jgi:hypothetical protein
MKISELIKMLNDLPDNVKDEHFDIYLEREDRKEAFNPIRLTNNARIMVARIVGGHIVSLKFEYTTGVLLTEGKRKLIDKSGFCEFMADLSSEN